MNSETKVLTISAIIILINAIKKKKKQEKFKRCRALWSRAWLLRRGSGKDLSSLAMCELRLEDPKGFRNFTRISPNLFFELLEKIAPMISKQDTVMREAIPVKTKLLATLHFLATGSSYVELSYGFRISVQALSEFIPETLSAIFNSLKNDYLKVPQSEVEWDNIAKEFENKWNFPQCLGAIDGKHIAIRPKKEYGSYFFNYKGFHSIILLAIVDASYKFLFVSAGVNGRANDAAAFSESSFNERLNNGSLNLPKDKELPNFPQKFPYAFIGDDAFRLSSRLLKPYGNRNDIENKIFNYRLSRARRVVENAFGILANRFRIFQKEINLPIEKAELIVFAACTLHNYIKSKEGFDKGLVDEENTTQVSLTNGSWRSNVEISNLQRSHTNRSADEAIYVRNMYSKYFNTVGFVPWQWEAVKKFNF